MVTVLMLGIQSLLDTGWDDEEQRREKGKVKFSLPVRGVAWTLTLIDGYLARHIRRQTTLFCLNVNDRVRNGDDDS